MEFERSRIPIIQPCSERNAGHLTCIACIVRTVSFVWAVIHQFGGDWLCSLCGCVPQRDVSALCCSCPHCIEQTMHCCTSWCRCTLSWTTRCCWWQYQTGFQQPSHYRRRQESRWESESQRWIFSWWSSSLICCRLVGVYPMTAFRTIAYCFLLRIAITFVIWYTDSVLVKLTAKAVRVPTRFARTFSL